MEVLPMECRRLTSRPAFSFERVTNVVPAEQKLAIESTSLSSSNVEVIGHAMVLLVFCVVVSHDAG
jgi:hypothetical protein